MRVVLVCVLTCFLACASTGRHQPARASEPLLAGVSELDITPAEPIRLTGYANRTAPSEGVRGRLWVKALAIGDRQRVAVLMAADLIGVPARLADEVARRLESRGVDRAHVAIAVTHTHTGPSLSGVLPGILAPPPPPDQQDTIDRYTRGLVETFERAAVAALADRRPAVIGWTQGRAGFAMNRRILKDGKWTGFGSDPSGVVDHDLPMLAVRAPDGRLRAVLVSYACHATTLEGKDNFVHGDWPAVAKELIQGRHPGAIALVTIGTGADANPNPRGGGLLDVERHAREVADEVDRLLQTPLHPLTSAPVGRFRRIDLAFAGVERAAPYPVQTWTFGDALTMVFLGGEVVADYGLRLKRELDATRLWVNAYSNDVAFYVASRRMIPEGGYEVDRSMLYYGQPGPLAESTEDRIVDAVIELAPAARQTTARE
ncbi:MAG: hypothetical protein HOQ29_16215 [Acidobacteria bacterium]|nr:hypothetical protein [Acidobacteriota bacterium]